MLPIYISILLISISVLAFEIALMRMLSITQWYHFAYMVISIALLGFGASGTFITILQRRLIKHFNAVFLICAFLFAFSIIISFRVCQKIKFDPFFIVWERRQLLYLFEFYLNLSIPFFFASICIGLTFLRFKEHINKVYFYNMVGSGVGAMGVVFLMYCIELQQIFFFVSICALIGMAIPWLTSLWATRTNKFVHATLSVLFIIFSGGYFFLFSRDTVLNISQYKSLCSTLNFPDAKIQAKESSPLGVIHVVSSPAIRFAPGLSLNYTGTIPEQLGIFVDGDSASAITNFTHDKKRLDYLDWTTSALPYCFVEKPSVLVMGTGGGGDVLLAYYHDARQIDGVELNPDVIKLVKDVYGEFSNGIYSMPNINIHIMEARGYIESTRKNYDLIQLSLLDSLSTSSAGVYALSESYLYTVEALETFMKHLNKGGVLAITRWIKLPPRDNVKMFATAVEALERIGFDQPFKHLIFIRSWATATLVIKSTPFDTGDILKMKSFCSSRLFDVIYYPGVTEQEVNLYNILDKPSYYDYAKEILSSKRKDFYRSYIFNIMPATDDRPYFFHFFKWKSLPLLLRTMGREWIPFVEWGYIILIATLIQAIIISTALILLPLMFLPRLEKGNPPQAERFSIFTYFTCLGLAFMFIEIALMQKFVFFLAHPIYATSVVISTFLLFAGLGAYASKLEIFAGQGRFKFVITAIIVLLLFYIISLDTVFKGIGFISPWVKIIITIVMLAPVSFFMGMPFPIGLTKVSQSASSGPNFIPWAWGINGCASVLSPIIGLILAIHLGFDAVLIIGAGLYVTAGLVSLKL
ncbi:MAG: SAM-dependent methyltransferase [Planctomycetes bacterium]|nr:SAM-dependent methyltransferase [Planctomycetota bacterium]